MTQSIETKPGVPAQDAQVAPRPMRAPRGATLNCKGWLQEAAYRMLQNNLDPEVAERPDELVVYGGRGRAARSWPALLKILEMLRTLEDDETLLIQRSEEHTSELQSPVHLVCR